MSRRDSREFVAPITGAGDRCTVSTEKRTGGTIVTTVTGMMNVTLVTRLRLQLTAALDDETHDWVLDAAGLEKFDRDASEPFVEILGIFKARKGGRVIVVAKDALKMMFSSIGMSSVAGDGPALEIVPTLVVALNRLGRKPEEMDGQR
ncbi:hypothetical protein K8R04_00395 [Candidatus Uhrbacteria bacterium]|nr:hypothetical protein [Candidatus Uhrbacteria bacterium]